MAFEQFMPGATAVGVTFDSGVVLAAEKRLAFGTYIVSKSGKKTFRITDHVGAACAGMVADMQILIRQIEAFAKIRALEMRRPVPPNSIAKMVSVMLFERRYFPLLTQVIIGGIDTKPVIYTLDPLGSLLPDDFAAAGTGAEIAIGVIESGYKAGMTEKDARDLAVKSIRSAVSRDAASGDGVDILVITKKGCKEESVKF
ncbi:MAG: proteasome beta subunit [Candidatus Nitrosomirales archaeon]|jgi:proteasome beta subunit